MPDSPRTFEESLDAKLQECREVMIRKQMDYGPGNIALWEELGVAVRLTDKVERLRNLFRSGRKPKNESIRDTFLDIANYGIIGLLLLDGQWGLPFEAEEGGGHGPPTD